MLKLPRRDSVQQVAKNMRYKMFSFRCIILYIAQGNSRCCAPCSLECQTAARNDECPASCRQYEGNPTCCGGCPQKCIDAAKYYLTYITRVISHDTCLFTVTREMSHHADNIGEILSVTMSHHHHLMKIHVLQDAETIHHKKLADSITIYLDVICHHHQNLW